MASSDYLRTRTISKRVGGVVVTLMQTGDQDASVWTVRLAVGDVVVETFTENVATIARAVKEMAALMQAED